MGPLSFSHIPMMVVISLWASVMILTIVAVVMILRSLKLPAVLESVLLQTPQGFIAMVDRKEGTVRSCKSSLQFPALGQLICISLVLKKVAAGSLKMYFKKLLLKAGPWHFIKDSSSFNVIEDAEHW